METGLKYSLIEIIPPFGLFSPKRSILIFKLCALAAENCHRTTVSNLVHIASIWLCAESWANNMLVCYGQRFHRQGARYQICRHLSEPGGY
jgi:hypothetical protein